MVVLTYLYVYLKTSIKNRYLFKQQQDETFFYKSIQFNLFSS
jgi:hypothetical protein